MQTKDGLYCYLANKFGLFKLVECENTNALKWIMIKYKEGAVNINNNKNIEFTAADDESAILLYEIGEYKI